MTIWNDPNGSFERRHPRTAAPNPTSQPSPSNTIEDQIDEIVLKPAHWQLDDYRKAKQAILDLITQSRKDLLTKLLTDHDTTCGAKFAENERDDCTLRQQIFDELKKKGK